MSASNKDKAFFKLGPGSRSYIEKQERMGISPDSDYQFRDEYIYMTFLSYSGCRIEIKAQFSENKSSGDVFNMDRVSSEMDARAQKQLEMKKEEVALKYIKEL